ncbi:MAG: secretin and TonB N-terminal domain-containing protein [candidate division NC10 bacterium]
MLGPRSMAVWGTRVFLGSLLLMTLAGFAEASEFASSVKAPRRVTMDFTAVELDRPLQIIGQISGLNMVVGRDVRGRVTVRLRDVPWEQALDSILRANGYGYIRQGNIIRIDKLDILRREREARFPPRQC